MPEFISVKVLTLRELFSGEYRFELPWFQRAYAWDTDEVGRLFTHLAEAARNGSERKPYFLGTLVIAKQPGGPATALIDGQQRIMTLTIFFAALRDMEATGARKTEIQGLVGQPGTYHLVPQENCSALCQRLVQNEGATSLEAENDEDDLSDAERNIIENRDHLKALLAERMSDGRTRWELFQYLADQCHVVVHAFRDSEEAWRWLQREEETQHRFNAADKAKTSLTLAMPARDRESCGLIWDECEALLGGEDLFELLRHLRLLKRRKFSAKPVESELSKEFELQKGGLDFVEQHLRPTASRVATLRAGETGTGDDRGRIAASAERASWIDDQIWMPAALLWLESRGQDGETALFFKRVERLVWLMRLSGMDSPKKEERVIRLLSEIDGRAPVEAMKSLAIDGSLKAAVVKALRAEAFDRKHYARPVLRLAGLALGDGPGVFAEVGDTLEHIYPQGKGGRGPWRADFPSKAESNAHKLGNLTLLSKEDNRRLANKVWSEKRPVYATSEFVLSREIADLARWTPVEVAERTERLIKIVLSYWEI